MLVSVGNVYMSSKAVFSDSMSKGCVCPAVPVPPVKQTGWHVWVHHTGTLLPGRAYLSLTVTWAPRCHNWELRNAPGPLRLVSHWRTIAWRHLIGKTRLSLQEQAYPLGFKLFFPSHQKDYSFKLSKILEVIQSKAKVRKYCSIPFGEANRFEDPKSAPRVCFQGSLTWTN